MIIAVDFDGCLASAGTWPGVGEPNEALQKAVEFCKVHGLEFDAVNDNLEELKQLYGNNSRKISADLYIDDKALKVEFPERTNDE